MEILFELGISYIYEFFRPPFTLTSESTDSVNVSTIFDALIKSNDLQELGLEVYLIDSASKPL